MKIFSLKKTAAILILFLGVNLSTADAQNLVIDPGFEEAIHLLKEGSWCNLYNYNGSKMTCTSDLFNLEEPDKYLNSNIYQEASVSTHSGNKAIGIILMFFDQWDCYSREFIQGRLIAPLKAGQYYRISMFVRFAKNDYFKLPLTDIGIALTDSIVRDNDICEKYLPYLPLVANTALISAHHEWQEISQIYQAKGGEQYLTIGGFLGNSFDHIIKNASNKKAIPYYFFDDVRVVEIPQEAVVNQAPPPEEIPAVKPQQSIHFEHNSATVENKYLPTIKAVADHLKETPWLKLQIIGHTDNVGSPTRNQFLSEERAKAVTGIFAEQGIPTNQLRYKGVANHKNTANNNSEQGRLANRKCDLRLLYQSLPSEEQLAALQDFAKLYGYIRYFYPKDWSGTFDWDQFAAYGVHRIRQTTGKKELYIVLQELLLPVAPAMSLCESKAGCSKTIPLGDHYQFWQHLGVNSGGNEVYESRLVSTINRDLWLFDKVPTSQKISGRGVSGIYYEIPLALPVTDALYTTDVDSLINATVLLDEDKYVANTMIAWNLIQHFYPYLDYLQLDWDAHLAPLLEVVGTLQEEEDFTVFLKTMAALLQDGHAGAFHPGQSSQMFLPMELDWQEEKLIIKQSGNVNMQSGDILLEIDGKSATDILRQDTALISGSPQWKVTKTLQNLGSGKQYSPAKLLMEREGETIEVTITRDWGDYPEPTLLKTVAKDVYYVDLKNIYEIDTIVNHLDQFANAKAIIFDVRGYLYNDYAPLLARMLTTTDTVDNWIWTPQIVEPDQHQLSFLKEGWGIESVSPKIPGRYLFLTDGNAVSSSESFLAFVQHYQLGTIIGSPTAGANGSRNWTTLLLGYKFHWTGMYVTNLSGECYHATGVIPDIFVTSQLGEEDAVLKRAIEEALKE